MTKMKFLGSLFLTGALTTTLVAPHRSRAQEAPKKIEIIAKRFEFSPNEITVKKGDPVELIVTSQDVDHGLKITELGVNLKISKGKPSEATFTPTEAGDFTGQCTSFCGPGHGGMKMTIHVTE
jgi:cytochrome c oxidase subunit 2